MLPPSLQGPSKRELYRRYNVPHAGLFLQACDKARSTDLCGMAPCERVNQIG